MKAVVMDDFGSIALTDVEEPRLHEAKDAIVRVRRAAICGSDLHILHGKIPGMLPGGVIGHEFTGVVEQVADGVRDIAVGDRVVGSFLVPCGDCAPCRVEEFNNCVDLRSLGYGMLFGDLAGAQAERVRTPNADLTLMRIPEGLDDEQALFAGDILSTAMYANRLGGSAPGKLVAVQGCGPVGILTIQFAKALGVERVVAVDIVQDRLDMAARLGAEPLNVAGQDPGSAIEALAGGGTDVVLDTAGGPSAVLAQAFDLVRPGGTVAVVGVYADMEMTIPLAELFVKALTLRFGGTCPVPAIWKEAISLVEAGAVDPTVIISHRLPLSEALLGYELFAARNATKVVLEVGD